MRLKFAHVCEPDAARLAGLAAALSGVVSAERRQTAIGSRPAARTPCADAKVFSEGPAAVKPHEIER